MAATEALGHTTHYVFDAATHSLPVKVWQAVGIAAWSAGTVHENWLTEPVGVREVVIRSWKVYNSAGSLWLELDNEGYAKEHYYDLAGMEVEVVSPDNDDERGFAAPLAVAALGNDFDDFTAHPALALFLESRRNNPGVRIALDYQNDYLRTETDTDKSRGEVKVSGKQGNGTGLSEVELEYGADGAEYSVKRMEYDSLGRECSGGERFHVQQSGQRNCYELCQPYHPALGFR